MHIGNFKVKGFHLFIWFSFSAVSFLSIIIILFNINDNYALLFLLPTCFLMLNFFTIFRISKLYNSLPALVIIAGYFIRIVITPVFFCLGGYNSFYNDIVTSRDISNSIFFMIYEFSIVIFALVYISSKRTTTKLFPKEISVYKYNTKILTLLICLLCLFLVFAYFYIPAISSIYNSILSTTFSETTNVSWDNETIVTRGSFERYIYSLFTFLWPIVRLLLPSLLVAQIYKKFGIRRKSIAYSSFALMIPFLIVSGDNIGPFISAIVAIIVVYRLYGRKALPLFYTGSIAIIIVLSIIISAKIKSFMVWRGGYGIAVVAQILNAYFPGFENVAITSMIFDSNKISTLFFDLYSTIPFRETLFRLNGINLSDLFRLTSSTGGQIIPFSAQIAHYTEFIVAPFITAIFVNVAMRCEEKAGRSENYWQNFLYIYISILTAMSINNYSFVIYIRTLVNIVLPIKIIMVVAGYKVKRKTKFSYKANSMKPVQGKNI